MVGMISVIKEITTKNNDVMAFVKVNDEYGDNTIRLSLSSFAFKYGVENALYL